MSRSALERFDSVWSMATANHGFITTAELRSLGVPTSTVTRWCRAGLITRIHRGIYKTGSEGFGFDEAVGFAQKLMAADQAVGRRSALAMWQLPGGHRGRVCLVGPPGRVSTSRHVTACQYRDLRPVDMTSLDGLRITTPVRTVIDSSRFCGIETIGRQLSEGVKRRLFTYQDVSFRLFELSRPGKQGLSKLRRVLAPRLGPHDVGLNGYEARARQLFAHAGLANPVCQYHVVGGGRSYFVDFAWPDAKLFVECDSMLAHSTPEQLQNDLRRQNDLLELGWSLLRFTYWDIAERPEEVVSTLRRFL